MQGGLYFLGAPLSEFIKVNFNGNVRSTRDGFGSMIWDPDTGLLVLDGSNFIETSVLYTKFQATWMGILGASQLLEAQRIFIKDNSVTVIE